MSQPAVMRCASRTLKPTQPRHCWCRDASISLWFTQGYYYITQTQLGESVGAISCAAVCHPNCSALDASSPIRPRLHTCSVDPGRPNCECTPFYTAVRLELSAPCLRAVDLPAVDPRNETNAISKVSLHTHPHEPRRPCIRHTKLLIRASQRERQMLPDLREFSRSSRPEPRRTSWAPSCMSQSKLSRIMSTPF